MFRTVLGEMYIPFSAYIFQQISPLSGSVIPNIAYLTLGMR